MLKNVLILEDEKDIAQLYAKRLKDCGYASEIAFDGLEGLEKLKKFSPDLILLDLNMPKMGGLEFYQHICDSKGNPMFPVIVLTGRAELETLFREFHIEGFLVKPFAASRLLSEVEIIFNKQCWKKTDGSAKRVIIVDDEHEPTQKIYSVFSDAGYKTDIATSGISGIEKIMADPPDLAMVKLGLADLSGDMVILRLQQIAKTRKTRTMLYVRRDHDQSNIVMENMAKKSGVSRMLEYSDPAELITGAIQVFKKRDDDDYY